MLTVDERDSKSLIVIFSIGFGITVQSFLNGRRGEKMDKISVIIPIYNVECYLKKCLDSVINQTYNNLEIILIDDGSPDKCGIICDEYAKNDSRIRVIHKKNGGLSAARNDALKLVTGKWISFVDSDDYCELDLYEKILPLAVEHDADIVLYGIYRGTVTGEIPVHPFSKEFVTENKEFISELQQSALNGRYTPISTSKWCQGYPWDKLFKASLILDNRLEFSTKVRANEDVIFNIHAFQFAKKIVYVDSLLYHFCFNPNSIGKKFTPDRVKVDMAVYSELFDIGKRYGLSDSYYQAVDTRIVTNTVLCASRCFFNPQMKGNIFQKIKYASTVLQSEPIFSAFERVDRNKLGRADRLATICRHHNVFSLYIIAKFRLIRRRINGKS